MRPPLARRPPHLPQPHPSGTSTSSLSPWVSYLHGHRRLQPLASPVPSQWPEEPGTMRHESEKRPYPCPPGAYRPERGILQIRLSTHTGLTWVEPAGGWA